ncbi:MAG: MogA/MoaB family molybdenum cofactor biosynthesis protein [Acidobacteriota bacterium]
MTDPSHSASTDAQGSGPSAQHRREAAGRRARCAVLTISDTRTFADDRSGPLMASMLEAAGHAVAARAIVPDASDALRDTVAGWIADGVEDGPIDLIVTSGGTGIAARDGTVERVAPLLDRVLDGFGELFRMLSYDQVGSAAMLSRAIGGLADGTFVFVLPGSPKAVSLALEKLIVPELPHLLRERDR